MSLLRLPQGTVQAHGDYGIAPYTLPMGSAMGKIPVPSCAWPGLPHPGLSPGSPAGLPVAQTDHCRRRACQPANGLSVVLKTITELHA